MKLAVTIEVRDLKNRRKSHTFEGVALPKPGSRDSVTSGFTDTKGKSDDDSISARVEIRRLA